MSLFCFKDGGLLKYNSVEEYKSTGLLLKLLSPFLLIIAIYDSQPLYVPFSISYVLASLNPWRHRIVVNIGLLLHFLSIANGIYTYSGGDTHQFLLIPFHAVALLLLAKFYPTPYPLWMNITAFLFSTESNVEWIERHPHLFKTLSKNTIIGSILGLYYNSRAFNIILEEGFLGFSPVKDILDAAHSAGLRDGVRILEIGSGLGGPICAIAGEYHVQAVGLDFLLHNTMNAKDLAYRRNLSSRVSFINGDGMHLPFRDGTFDFVYGSDAWCHVPDRLLMLREASRVLRRDGRIFFYDWLDTGGISEGFRFIYAFPPLETIDSYKDKLKASQFEIIRAEYDTEHYLHLVENVNESVLKNKRRIIDECGRELYDNWLIVISYTLRMLYEKKLGHGLFIAKKI